MELRVWKGMVPAQDAETYAAFLDERWVGPLTALDANRGVIAMHHEGDDDVEFVVISFWSPVAPVDVDETVTDAYAEPPIALGASHEYFVRGELAFGVGMLE